MLSFLWRYLRPQRSAAALMALLLLASTALQLSGPQVLRSFINAVMAGAAEAVLRRTALLFVGVSLVAQVLKVAAAYWSDRVAWTASNALRLDLAGHLLRLDAGFHKTRSPGELIERVDGDVNALAGFFSSLAVQLAGSLLLVTGVLAALWLVSGWLGVAYTAFAVLTVLALGQARRWGTPYQVEVRERSAQFYGCLGEVIGAAEDIRSSGAVPYAMGRLARHLRAWQPFWLGAEVRGAAVWMAAMVAFAAAEALAYALGGGLFRQGAVSLGTVYLVVAYAALLAQPIETIRTELQHLQRAEASLGRVHALLRTKSTVADGPAVLPAGPLAVDAEQLSFRYEEEWVLRDLTFHLRPGRRLGLLGRTGSGKSTLARLLVRLYDTSAGTLRLGGIDLQQVRLKELRQRVGLVTQEVQLFEATLRENLTLFDAMVPAERLLGVLDDLGLRPWLERLPQGLETVISPAALSAGEAQLLAFARVFLQDSGLVILDEASSRLDPATEALVDRAVSRLLAGRTAIIIAHRLSTVERLDEIMILEAGRVLEHGERAQLAADPGSRFARLRQTGLTEVLG